MDDWIRIRCVPIQFWPAAQYAPDTHDVNRVLEVAVTQDDDGCVASQVHRELFQA